MRRGESAGGKSFRPRFKTCFSTLYRAVVDVVEPVFFTAQIIRPAEAAAVITRVAPAVNAMIPALIANSGASSAALRIRHAADSAARAAVNAISATAAHCATHIFAISRCRAPFARRA